MKKWRHVRYEDDGVDSYQCLVCKAMWQMRGVPDKFCMYCGIRFEGQHECHDQDERQPVAPQTRPGTVFVVQRMTKIPTVFLENKAFNEYKEKWAKIVES